MSRQRIGEYGQLRCGTVIKAYDSVDEAREVRSRMVDPRRWKVFRMHRLAPRIRMSPWASVPGLGTITVAHDHSIDAHIWEIRGIVYFRIGTDTAKYAVDGLGAMAACEARLVELGYARPKPTTVEQRIASREADAEKRLGRGLSGRECGRAALADLGVSVVAKAKKGGAK